MPPREKIDVEALLIRAYAEKRVHMLKRVREGALGLPRPRKGIGGMGGGEKVDTSSFSARVAGELREMQARLGAAPSGLLDLHDVVLGLENFYVERGAGLDFVVWDHDTAERLGHRIVEERGSSTASIAAVRPRTGADKGGDTHVEVGPRRRLFKITTSTLVVLHGQYGDRPHVTEAVPVRMRPVYRGADKRAVGHVPEYAVPEHTIVEERASYAAWRAALVILREVFASSAEYEVTGPAAPAEPWAAPVRVLRARRRVSGLRDAAEAHVLAWRALPREAHVLAWRAATRKKPGRPRKAPKPTKKPAKRGRVARKTPIATRA